jgi:divalent metal cation (Fe/Co/Zn/Cd) transporter
MHDRPGQLRRAIVLSAVSVVLNGITGGLAVVVALLTGSLSLLGFGFDAAVDSVASVALIWRFSVETREPHRAERVEKLAERIVGIVLLALAAYLALGAVRSLAAGSHPEPSIPATVLLLVSLAFLPPLALAKRRVADRLGSGALRADSILTAVAAFLALVSLVSVTLSATLGVWWADAVGSLLIAAVLAREGVESVRASRGEHTVAD